MSSVAIHSDLSYRSRFRQPTSPEEETARLLLRVKTLSWILLYICAVFQSIFFLSPSNFFAIACIIFSWKIATTSLLSPVRLQNYPLSTFLILGFVSTQFYLPLIATSVEFKPVDFNLEFPYHVFFHSVIALLILVFSHHIYRLGFGRPTNTIRSFLERAKVFAPPTEPQLWLMGIIGIFATYYVAIYLPSIGQESSGPVNKFVAGLIPFSYSPFFIPFRKLYGDKLKPLGLLIPSLLAFSILLFAISIGRNSRSSFMLGFTSLGLAYGLGLLLGVFKARILTPRNLAIATMSFWLLIGPIADLGTAMVIVRGKRTEVFGKEFIALTLNAFQDKEEIRKYRLEDKMQMDLSEYYLDNILLARFCNLKFSDTSLALASRLNETNTSMLVYSVNRFWAIFPENILEGFSIFGIDVDKESVNSLSYGSYLLKTSGYEVEQTGPLRVGHFAGTGMAAFGWSYLLILGIGIIPVYVLSDSLFKKEHVTRSGPGFLSNLEVRISFCGLLFLTITFLFLPTESVVNIFSFILRDWIQMILLYLLLFHFTKFLVRVLKTTSLSS